MKINVMSAMMGSGKTTKLIDYISKLPMDSKIMYITPLLSECHRIAGTYCLEADEQQKPVVARVYEDGGVEYDYSDPTWVLNKRRFRHPVLSSGGSKLDTLAVQVENGCNITSTHALFRNVNSKVIEMLKKQEYILVLDEVLSVYEEFDDLKAEEVAALMSSGVLYLDDDKITLRFSKERFPSDHTRYNDIADLCDVGQLCLIDGKVVIWEFPVEALKVFKEVHIATYLFEGSPMCAYLTTYGFDVDIQHFGNSPREIHHLVEIVTDKKMNNVGVPRAALSQSDLCVRKTSVEEVRKNLRTFFNKYKVKHEHRLWTTYKSAARSISGGKYAQSWLFCGAKATNDWRNTSHVAYLVNIHLRPMLVKLMATKGYDIDQDIYALSEMVQFLWRSRIRSGEKVVIYVPSSRMRTLLINWLNGQYDNI